MPRYRFLIAAFLLVGIGALPACGSGGLSADQNQCIKAFNSASGSATLGFQTILGKPISKWLPKTQVAVQRVANYHNRCLVTFVFPFSYYMSSNPADREPHFMQWEFPANWTRATDAFSTQFRELGDPTNPGALADLPDSVRKELDAHLKLETGQSTPGRENYGVESNPPLNIVYR